MNPKFLDFLNQLWDRSSVPVLQLILYPVPAVFDRIHIRRIAWPIHHLKLLVPEHVHDNVARVTHAATGTHVATVILHEYFGANAQPVSILQTCFRPLLDLGKYKSRYGHKDMILRNNYLLKLGGRSTKINYFIKGVSIKKKLS